MSVFDSLIDQEETVAILKEAVIAAKNNEDESQNMTHAWLFTGPPGSGRSNAALAFAAALLCPNSGCNNCIDCRAALNGVHVDVELIKTEGLSIKIDEIRELITRSSWTPSVAQYRVVVIEDADRLTESAANALLKAIEEPGLRTVWLLCAPTLTDVMPTIRSRTRNLTLRTPSIKAVTNLLESELIQPKIAEFAARASQGHIGRARYLANNSEARTKRTDILKLPLTITDIASAFKCAQLLVDAAKQEAEADAEKRNDVETAALKEAWGQQGTRLVQGGARAVKELEKEQKSRQTRMVRDYLDRALLDIATFYRDILLFQSGMSSDDAFINSDMRLEIESAARNSLAEITLQKLEAIMKTRTNLARNAAPLLAVEALMVQLR
ncbi:MAG: DNA polymerase III subunit delta' [Actinomycetota bacterium]